MEQQGKYYNPEYPETSNEWTRKWDKSWLLRKDEFLLKYATEEQRIMSFKTFRNRFILGFFVFFLILYSQQYTYGLELKVIIPIQIILAILFIRFPNILYLILSMIICLFLPMYLISNSYDQELIYKVLLLLSAIILLMYGVIYLLYFCFLFFTQIDSLFCDFFEKILNERDNFLVEKFQKKISGNKILVFVFRKLICDGTINIMVANNPVYVQNNRLANSFIDNISRVPFLYSWLFILNKDSFSKERISSFRMFLYRFSAIYSLVFVIFISTVVILYFCLVILFLFI